MTIRIVIDNEDAADVRQGGSDKVWTANAYLLVGPVIGEQVAATCLTSTSPGIGATPQAALADMRPDIDITPED